MAPALLDITGQTYARLTVLERTNNLAGRTMWVCRCECGKTLITSSNSLRCGKTRSCGCLKKEEVAKHAQKAGEARGRQLVKHGRTGTRLYNVWKSMHQRCNNPHNKFYKNYGGRGIRVCSEWKDYSVFHSWAIKEGYNPEAPFGTCTLDRIDNDKGYSPRNCRWVSLDVQANNRRERRR